MGYPFNKKLWFSTHKPLPVPSLAERRKIKVSLGIPRDHPFMKCPGKSLSVVKDFEAKGDFSHSGDRNKHICEKCRCKRVAGYGTKHYGVGYCFYHDTSSSRGMTKTMTVALQQGYPMNPIKYRSESEYINDVRKQAEDANGRLSLGEELNLIRAHLQEFEMKWKELGDKSLTMKAGAKVVEMSDDVKINILCKLGKTISELTRDAYIITESDYCHIDEVKVWLWDIWQCVERNIKKMIQGEMNQNDLQSAIQEEFKKIVLPKTGRSKK